MKALIVSGGEKPSTELLKEIAFESKLIIGADKGCDSLYDSNIVPKYIVGDFDSASMDKVNYLKECGAIKIEFNPEKDFTDSDSALNLAIEEGANEVVLLGVTGTRLDHTFGNLGLLTSALKRSVKATIINENNKIFIVNNSISLNRDNRYKYISFLAYGDVVKNLNIINAKYNLKNYDLFMGDTMTVSNEFIDEKMYIEFESGKLLVIYSND
ncbi:thiamine diphosphokinase [Clostridium saudiense]|nr:thiamine diphosphokinase [Clostridium saudiense]